MISKSKGNFNPNTEVNNTMDKIIQSTINQLQLNQTITIDNQQSAISQSKTVIINQ
jgi:hypothetical protein